MKLNERKWFDDVFLLMNCEFCDYLFIIIDCILIIYGM